MAAMIGLTRQRTHVSGSTLTRREMLAAIPAAGVSGFLPESSFGRQRMQTRSIPRSDESLPIIGLDSSKPVAQISERDPEPISKVLQTLVAIDGRAVDTWPRDPANDAAVGDVICQPELRDTLIIASKFDRTG